MDLLLLMPMPLLRRGRRQSWLRRSPCGMPKLLRVRRLRLRLPSPAAARGLGVLPGSSRRCASRLPRWHRRGVQRRLLQNLQVRDGSLRVRPLDLLSDLLQRVRLLLLLGCRLQRLNLLLRRCQLLQVRRLAVLLKINRNGLLLNDDLPLRHRVLLLDDELRMCRNNLLLLNELLMLMLMLMLMGELLMLLLLNDDDARLPLRRYYRVLNHGVVIVNTCLLMMMRDDGLLRMMRDGLRVRDDSLVMHNSLLQCSDRLMSINKLRLLMRT